MCSPGCSPGRDFKPSNMVPPGNTIQDRFKSWLDARPKFKSSLLYLGSLHPTYVTGGVLRDTYLDPAAASPKDVDVCVDCGGPAELRESLGLAGFDIDDALESSSPFRGLVASGPDGIFVDSWVLRDSPALGEEKSIEALLATFPLKVEQGAVLIGGSFIDLGMQAALESKCIEGNPEAWPLGANPAERGLRLAKRIGFSVGHSLLDSLEYVPKL